MVRPSFPLFVAPTVVQALHQLVDDGMGMLEKRLKEHNHKSPLSSTRLSPTPSTQLAPRILVVIFSHPPLMSMSFLDGLPVQR